MLKKKEGKMEAIQILSTGSYLPRKKIENEELERKWNLEKGYIQKRSGICSRFFCEEESLEDLAYYACMDCIQRSKLPREKIEGIIVASTTNITSMPGLSFRLQKRLSLPDGILCLDISAGCSGYINGVDLARMYLGTKQKEHLLIVGVEYLSSVVAEKDYALKMLLADGAGAILLGRCEDEKVYQSEIQSKVEETSSLSYTFGGNLTMDGLSIYKYAVTEGSKIVQQMLKKAELTGKDLQWIVAHQSNLKIIEAIAKRLNLPQKKFYTNLQNVGNTFCASIPIALDEMEKKNLLKKGDKIMLLGYGGGLNTGCILLER